MNERNLLGASACALAQAIRQREVTSTHVVEVHQSRIEQVNPFLNAVVQKTFADAHQLAREVDARLQKSASLDHELPPFFGVPCTIKEHLSVKGLPNTGGLVRRASRIAQRDATLVARMRSAGFVIMGTTNVPEGLTWYESYNRIYGRTNNAWSTSHTCGGSSGGEGAIIGAGGSPIGLGGDLGGSIRIPAMFNGIVGHKATGGRIPETGAWPGVKGLIRRYKVLGPMARRIEDLVAVMPLLAGPDGDDLSVDGPSWGKAPEYDPSEVTVYYFDDNGIISPTDEMKKAIADSVHALERAGYRVEAWRPPGIERGLQIWFGALKHSGGPRFIEVLGDLEEQILLGTEWKKWPLRKSHHIFPALALATIERALGPLGKLAPDPTVHRDALQSAIETQLGDKGVLLCPVFHRTAPKHGLDAMRSFVGFSYSGSFNPLELPATSVPTGFAENGLPVGVQLLGKRNHDHLTLHVAAAIERELGGWQLRDAAYLKTAVSAA